MFRNRPTPTVRAEPNATRHLAPAPAGLRPLRCPNTLSKARVGVPHTLFPALPTHRRPVLVKTSTLDTPTVPAAPEQRPAVKTRTDAETTIPVTVHVSGRKQWGVIIIQVELVDEQGNKCSRAGITLAATPPLLDIRTQTNVNIKVPRNFGTVGAALVTAQRLVSGQQNGSIYLDHIAVRDHNKPEAIVWAHSWVGANKRVRRFFVNTSYLPQNTPSGLTDYREAELRDLRGEEAVVKGGKPEWKPKGGTRADTDRIYDYQVYNDLSGKDFGPEHPEDERPTLGGGPFYYPRRLYSGRPLVPGTDKEEAGKRYLPLDERFNNHKLLAFGYNSLKSLLPWKIESMLPWRHLREFTGFDDVSFVYQNTWKAMLQWLLVIPGLSAALRVEALPPLPLVARGRSTTWDDDYEFGRQIIAGMHPCALAAVTNFEDWKATGSKIRNEHVRGLVGEPSFEDAMDPANPKLFCIDYASLLLEPLNSSYKTSIIEEVNKHMDTGERKENATDKEASPVFQYAPRCLLYLNTAGKLTPIAVELCLPGRSEIVTPNDNPLRWRLAKSHFLVADAGYHQLIAHWLRTHACVEPFIIATMRQLSAMHPLWKLLRPHFKYTLHINANARERLISGNGVIEKCFNPGSLSLALSARVYQDWRFEEQALPADLKKRGMLVKNANGPVEWKGTRYAIVMGEDYPYAADGMLVWDALRGWAKEYLGTYYSSNADLEADTELQNWWSEVKTKGHVDAQNTKKDDEKGWPALTTLDDLADIATTVAWLASGHHAAVNFGQYSYSGYFANYPTSSRKPIPDMDTKEWKDMATDPDKAFLESFSSKQTAIQVMGVVKLLSTHDSGEEYLGTRTDEKTWSSRKEDKDAWDNFKAAVADVEATIHIRNDNNKLKHRYLKYELLVPSLGEQEIDVGPPARGVPNSVSI